MTNLEFERTRFRSGMKVNYKDKVYDIVSVDFEENLIGIQDTADEDHLSWKRCENCELIK